MSQDLCFIIAEAGVNHNGDIALAKKLIDAAKTAGADAVKFQTWITELLVTEDSKSAKYQQQNTGQESQFDLLKSLELSHKAFAELQRYAETQDILFLSTPDEEVSAKFLIDLGIPLIKVGSGELTNLPFLHFLSSHNLPMIISTGMATLEEVKTAVKTIHSTGNKDLTILHCVSNYPASPEECNLRAMQTMATEFNCPIGYSDHTTGIDICLAAVALGATVIEKHITLDRTMAGPDHACSTEPDEFAEMVASSRRIEQSMGDGIKRPTSSELETKKIVRKEVMAAKDLPAGTILDLQDLCLKRSNGSGVPAENIHEVLGSKLLHDKNKNQPIPYDALSR